MDRPSASGTYQAGVTLIEQIMVLVIVAAMMAVALPPMSRLLVRVKLQTAQMDLIGAMQNARATAVFSGKVTILCPTIDGRHCRNDMRWEDGWLLAHELENPRSHRRSIGRAVYVGSGYGSKLKIYSDRALIRFQNDGTAGGTNQTVVMCSRDGKAPALVVIIDNVGRARGRLADKNWTQVCSGAK